MFKKEKIKDLHYFVEGSLSADEIQNAADEILTKYGKDAKIPGFRPGHIPMSVLRQRHGESAWAEAADDLINRDMNNYANDKKIRLAAAPKADISKFEIGKDVEYSLEFDILPKLEKIDLDKFSITKKTTSATDEEIEKSMQNLRKARAQAEKQEDSCKAENGDVAIIDFKGFVDDTPFAGGEAEKHHLTLGGGQFIPGFEDQIIGHKAGDKFDVKVKFPKEYHAENLSGKDAKFEVVVHEIRRPVLPELNDELAKSVGQESLTALREHIKNILNDQYEQAAKSEMRNELLEILADKVKIDLPEALVAKEVEMAKQEFEHQASHGAAGKSKWDEKEELKDAQRRVKLGLILAEWGNQNGVKVDNKDLQQAIWAEAGQYPNPQEVFEFYNKNQNALTVMRGMIFERKALDAMLEKVKIKEKPVKSDELFKQSEPK